jgi:probable HAF family extracellular repeat protein
MRSSHLVGWKLPRRPLRGAALILAAALATVAAAAAPASAAGTFQGLGLIAGSVPGSDANGVSADGLVVVGGCPSYSSTCAEGWRWTQETGMVGLGFLSGDTSSQATAASADGSVVVGESGDRPVRWVSGGGGWQDLSGGLPAGSDASATDVSASGGAVIGFYLAPTTGGNFLWTPSETTFHLPFSLPSVAALTAISADGTLMSAYSGVFDRPTAQRYSPAGGSEVLPELVDLDLCQCGSSANGISPAGDVVVGDSFGQAFLWSEAMGSIGLGFLSEPTWNQGSIALDVSADGSIVVGYASVSATKLHAFVWISGWGMHDANKLFPRHGIDLTGWTLTEATGISDDGTVIVGTGINPSGRTEAWRAELPELRAVPIPALPGPGTALFLGAALAAAFNVRRSRARPKVQSCGATSAMRAP